MHSAAYPRWTHPSDLAARASVVEPASYNGGWQLTMTMNELSLSARSGRALATVSSELLQAHREKS